MNSFSLWSDPWIPVDGVDGRPHLLDLFHALTDSHTLRGVGDPSPLITVALHRLLIALVYRTHPVRRFRDWQAIWRGGQFDARALRAYGEGMHDRFDLLHPTRPFYQVGLMADEKIHPVADLVLEASKGNNPALFDHGRVEGLLELPLDRAACYLVAHQLFAIGGGVSKPFNRMDAPLTKGLIVEVVGRTLFETLMLNALPAGEWERLAPTIGHDKPFWEEDQPPAPEKNGTPVQGPLHYLTWQSRRIHLVVDIERRTVTHCQIAQGYCLPKDSTRIDPGKAYIRDEEKGWRPRRLQKGRAAWRLTHALLEPIDETGARPEVVSWLAALRRHERLDEIVLPAAVGLAVSGLTTDPKLAAKIELWRREEIGLPLDVLEDLALVRQVGRMMDVAAMVERLLRRSGETLVWAMGDKLHQPAALHYFWTGKASPKIPPWVGPLSSSLGLTLRYWAAMEGPFRSMLGGLPGQAHALADAAWRDALGQNARKAMVETLNDLRVGGAPWEPLALVDDAFGRRLTRLLRETGDDEDDHTHGDD